MTEEKVKCRQCGVLFLKTTADCTDGLCMPCYKGEYVEGQDTDEASDAETTLSDWIKVGVWGTLIVVWALTYKLMIGLAVFAIAYFLLGCDFSTSATSGVVAYVLLKLLEGVDQFRDYFANRSKEKKMKAFHEEWTRRHDKRTQK